MNVRPHSKKDVQGSLSSILEKSDNFPSLLDDGSHSSLISNPKIASIQDMMLCDNDSTFYGANPLDKIHKILKLPPLISSPSQNPKNECTNEEVDITFIKDKQNSINSVELPQSMNLGKTPVIHETDNNNNKSDRDSFSSDGNDYNQYDTVDNFQPAMPYHEIYSGSVSKYVHRNLLQNTTYFYRVRCKNNAGYGPWSKVLKCTTRLLANNRKKSIK